MYHKPIMVRELENDYDSTQLIPKRVDGSTTPSYESIEDLSKRLGETASMRMRFAVAEAVIDEVIGDTMDEQEMENEGVVNTGDVEAVVEPIVDKAVALGIIPAAMKQRVPALIAARMKRKDYRLNLAVKAAHYAAAAMTKMEDKDVIVDLKEDEDVIANAIKGTDNDTYILEVEVNDCPDEEVVSKSLDDQPADTGTDINTDTVVRKEPEVAMLEVRGVPRVLGSAIRKLAKSSAAHHRASIVMAHRYAGVMVDKFLKEMQYHLPEKFMKKYGG